MTEIIGIILAAGMSKRMGCNKLLLPFHGIPMLQHSINAARASKLTRVLLIVPDEAGAQEMLSHLDTSECIVLYNALRHLGQAESLKLAISYILDFICEEMKTVQGAMVLLGDQPFVTASIINDLLDKACAHRQAWIIPQRRATVGTKNERGNPVIIPADEFGRVLQIQGDSGARVLLDNSPFPVHFVHTKHAAPFMDIDTPEMYSYFMENSKCIDE